MNAKQLAQQIESGFTTTQHPFNTLLLLHTFLSNHSLHLPKYSPFLFSHDSSELSGSMCTCSLLTMSWTHGIHLVAVIRIQAHRNNNLISLINELILYVP